MMFTGLGAPPKLRTVSTFYRSLSGSANPSYFFIIGGFRKDRSKVLWWLLWMFRSWICFLPGQKIIGLANISSLGSWSLLPCRPFVMRGSIDGRTRVCVFVESQISLLLEFFLSLYLILFFFLTRKFIKRQSPYSRWIETSKTQTIKHPTNQPKTPST